jgi:hypothetical protein
MEKYLPVVTSVHLMIMPQQGLYTVFVKIMLAGDAKPLTFETAPETSPKSAYCCALNAIYALLRDKWADIKEVVEEPAPEPPGHPAKNSQPSPA